MLERSRTVEDYLKQVLLLQQKPGVAARQPRSGRGRVSMGRLSRAMNVAAGTGTAMVKRLADAGLLDYEPYEGVRLTARGEKLATDMLRRHRLIETFLVQTLGLGWSEVHDEAERLEHAISDALLEKIDAVLGHPRFDPHGDPIPDRAGVMSQPNLRTLAECDVGESIKIARILDQRPTFLDFLDKAGLRPGAIVTLQRRDPIADALRVKTGARTAIHLGSGAAAKLLVARA